MLSRLPLPELLDAFASPAPTPGGGSAAALLGALGSALVAMVAGLPKSRNNTPDERQALDAAYAELAGLQKKLLELIDRDAGAYETVVAAYKLPKATDAEKAARSAAIQEGLKTATRVPLETLSGCAAAIGHARVVAQHGNPSALSDVAVGVQTLMAGIGAAVLNVQVNLGSVKDTAFVDEVTAEVRRELEGAGEALQKIMTSTGVGEFHQKVGAVLGGSEHGKPPRDLPPATAIPYAAKMLSGLAPADLQRVLQTLAASTDDATATAAREAMSKLD
jgi:methenyltetrahydrofolate cyclohydrolase